MSDTKTQNHTTRQHQFAGIGAKTIMETVGQSITTAQLLGIASYADFGRSFVLLGVDFLETMGYSLEDIQGLVAEFWDKREDAKTRASDKVTAFYENEQAAHITKNQQLEAELENAWATPEGREQYHTTAGVVVDQLLGQKGKGEA